MKHLELKAELVERYTGHYLLADPGHRIDHAIGVCDTALQINEDLNLNLNPMIIVGAAITHDIFTWSRANHHELVECFLLTTNEPWIRQFTEEERWLMAKAAGQHRASYKGEYSSLYSELISAADRGVPGNVDKMIKRCYLYSLHQLQLPPEEALQRVIPHLMEKYVDDAGTYGRVYNSVYLKAYGKQLDAIKETIRNLTLDHECFKTL